jgi:hypothetical protein
VGRHVPNVVLCGNRNVPANIPSPTALGKSNYFAMLEGMTSVLEACGYTIVRTVAEGDPIVIGAKKIAQDLSGRLGNACSFADVEGVPVL